MAEVRKIPSGLWQAIVVLPTKTASGRPKRVTKTHPLKRVVATWATSLESSIAAGTWIDERSSTITLSEWRARWVASRISDTATAKKNESHWTNHIEPVWGGHPLGLITRADLKTWVHTMHTQTCAGCRQRPGLTTTGVLKKHRTPGGRTCAKSGQPAGLGAWTIQGAVAHMSGLLVAAVDEGLIPGNPATRLNLPRTGRKAPFYWTRGEATAILLQLGGTHALAVDLNMHVGLRPGELFGLRRRDIDPDRWLMNVYGVATRTGWRPYAKTSRSQRAVPVPFHLRDRLLGHLLTLGPDDLVFGTATGKTWDDRNYARRIFDPAVTAAGVRRGTFYDTRHTAASWLVQGGVDLLDVQALMGHEKYSTTLIYAHLAPGAFGNVLAAWGDATLDPRATVAPRATETSSTPVTEQDPR